MAERQRHVVVFDVNVYLDIAHLVGPPYTREKFDALAASLVRVDLPHPDDRSFDSLRAVAVCTSGRFAGPEPLEVWVNDHILGLVESKATQSSVPDEETGYRGLGWTTADATSLVEDLVKPLVASTGGDVLRSHYPDGNPPLDHEDGMVYGACRTLSSDDLLCNVYCVTRDGGFLRAEREGKLSGHSKVLTPSTFVSLTRAARSSFSIKAMAPPH